MNAITALRRRAEKDASLDYRNVRILPKEFDALAWIKWSEALELPVQRSQSGIAFSCYVGDAPRSDDLMRQEMVLRSALNCGPGSDRKMAKLKKFFDARFPAIAAGSAIERKALRIISDNAKHLPLVKTFLYVPSGIQLYVGSAEEIEAIPFPTPEWKAAKIAELEARKAQWSLESSTPEVRKALASFRRAQDDLQDAAALLREGYTQQERFRQRLAGAPLKASRKTKNASITAQAA